MRQLQISDSVSDVLRRSAADGALLRLPDGQLDRKLYTDVNKVLEALGGKWDKHQKAHVFTRPVSDVLADALDIGAVTPPSKNGYFPTPPALVARLIELAGLEFGQQVLEPSAGQGAIADAILAAGISKNDLYLVEILPENVAVLESKGYSYPKLSHGDFLMTGFLPTGFDRIVMNPPFERQQDIDHITHAMSLLKPGGRLVSVMAAGVTFREDRKASAFRAMFDAFYGYMEDNPAGSFRPSGTDVSTVTVVLIRPA